MYKYTHVQILACQSPCLELTPGGTRRKDVVRSTDCPNVAMDVPSAQASGTFTQSLTLIPVTHLPSFSPVCQVPTATIDLSSRMFILPLRREGQNKKTC
jgi:hypothetical protein